MFSKKLQVKFYFIYLPSGKGKSTFINDIFKEFKNKNLLCLTFDIKQNKFDDV